MFQKYNDLALQSNIVRETIQKIILTMFSTAFSWRGLTKSSCRYFSYLICLKLHLQWETFTSIFQLHVSPIELYQYCAHHDQWCLLQFLLTCWETSAHIFPMHNHIKSYIIAYMRCLHMIHDFTWTVHWAHTRMSFHTKWDPCHWLWALRIEWVFFQNMIEQYPAKKHWQCWRHFVFFATLVRVCERSATCWQKFRLNFPLETF